MCMGNEHKGIVNKGKFGALLECKYTNLTFHPKLILPVADRDNSISKEFKTKEIDDAIKLLDFDTTLDRYQIYSVINGKYTGSRYNFGLCCYQDWKTLSPKRIKASLRNWTSGERTYCVNKYDLKYINNQAQFYKHVMIPEHYHPLKKQIPPELLEGHFTDEELRSIFIAGTAIGMSQRPESKVLYLDIDDHDGTAESYANAHNALEKLVTEIFKARPLFIQRSRVNGGYHVAFKIDRQLDDQRIGDLTKLLNRALPAHVDARTTTKAIRIPCCYDYTAGTIRIKGNRLIFSPFDRRDQHNKFASKVINCFDKPEYCVCYKNVITILQGEEIPDDRNSAREALYTRDNGSKAKLSTPELIAAAYPIYSGERNHTIPHSIAAMPARSSDFQGLQLAQVSSSDISSMTDEELYEHCAYQWKRLESKHRPFTGHNAETPSQAGPFISNLDKVPAPLMEIIKSPVFISHVLQLVNPVYKKVKEGYITEIPIIIGEIIGKIIYEHEKPRRCLSKHAHLNDRLCIGYQFPSNYLYALKAHHSLKRDVIRLVRAFLKSDILMSLRSSSYSAFPWLPYCKQYGIGDIPYGEKPMLVVHILVNRLRALIGVQSPHSPSSQSTSPVQGWALPPSQCLDSSYPLSQSPVQGWALPPSQCLGSPSSQSTSPVQGWGQGSVSGRVKSIGGCSYMRTFLNSKDANPVLSKTHSPP